ncbi:MAG: hypothetical protein ACUVS5_13210 [Anaerolineae bacterium]
MTVGVGDPAVGNVVDAGYEGDGEREVTLDDGRYCWRVLAAVRREEGGEEVPVGQESETWCFQVMERPRQR